MKKYMFGLSNGSSCNDPYHILYFYIWKHTRLQRHLYHMIVIFSRCLIWINANNPFKLLHRAICILFYWIIFRTVHTAHAHKLMSVKKNSIAWPIAKIWEQINKYKHEHHAHCIAIVRINYIICCENRLMTNGWCVRELWIVKWETKWPAKHRFFTYFASFIKCRNATTHHQFHHFVIEFNASFWTPKTNWDVHTRSLKHNFNQFQWDVE